jgi:integrase
MVYEPGEDVNVTAHGMRGLHSTLAIEAGMTGAVVAASLGHEHVSATLWTRLLREGLQALRQPRLHERDLIRNALNFCGVDRT